MKILILFILTALMIACAPFQEIPTKVRVSGDTQPDFVLSGSGDLSRFTVYDMTTDPDPRFPDTCIWKIEPINGEAEEIRDIGRIRYGVLPKHYKQIVPSEGTPPPKLKEGESYNYIPETENAPYSSGQFHINKGSAIDDSGKK